MNYEIISVRMSDSKSALKICLVRPPAILNKNAINRYSIPPIGLAYIASSLRQAGFRVSAVDGIGSAIHQYGIVPGHPDSLLYGMNFEEIVAAIDPHIDVLGISLMFSREWLLCRSFIEHLRRHFPRALIVVGGEHITACAEYSMQDCKAIDVAVLGEGEATIVELLQAHESGRDLRSVNGIVFRESESLYRTTARARIKEIDSIPNPAWDLFPLEEYLKNKFSIGFDIGRSAPLLASRGCPFQCSFCSNPTMWTTKWYSRKPRLVVNEMIEYIDRYQVTNFDFYDLTAIVKKDWIIEFCQILIEEKLNITWQLPSGTRSEALDAETLSWLFKAGCRSIIYAPESGSPEELHRIKKKVIIPRMLESMRISCKNNIRTKANIIFGMPGAGWMDVFHTYIFLIRMALAGVNDVGCFSFSPYPGSEMFRNLLASGQIHLNNDFFLKLNKFSNFSKTESYNKTFSGTQLARINICGMFIFYFCSLLFRPIRLFGFLSTIFGFNASSSLGRSLSNLKNRKRAIRLLSKSNNEEVWLQ